MTQTLTHLGDRMLSLVLREETAGACVPENGQSCGGCARSDGYCGSNGYWYWRYYRKVYNCDGSCRSVYCYASRSQLRC